MNGANRSIHAGFKRRSTEELLADYRGYLARERGLAESTIENYGRVARLFLSERERADGLALQRLTAAEVSGFLARECPKRGVAGARDLVNGLRQLLRYLHVAGAISVPLRWAVPAVADLRDRSLPRGLDAATVAKLLAGCDRRRMVGRRDYAILLLMVRLGLRAGEVAALSLDDLDWRQGEIVVHGKGGREDRLPLPVDVGRALVSYLRRRSQTESRGVFLRVRAPAGPLPVSGVKHVVSGACVARGVAAGRGASPAAHGRDRDAQGGRVAAGDRTGAAPPPAGDDRDLRHSRSQGAAPAGAAVARRKAMSRLREALNDYLQVRRRLGFQLKAHGRLLEDFVDFLERAGAEHITTELALAWAKLPVDARPHRWRQRLGIVRAFARYLAMIDPQARCPPRICCPLPSGGWRHTSTPRQRSRR